MDPAGSDGDIMWCRDVDGGIGTVKAGGREWGQFGGDRTDQRDYVPYRTGNYFRDLRGNRYGDDSNAMVVDQTRPGDSQSGTDIWRCGPAL